MQSLAFIFSPLALALALTAAFGATPNASSLSLIELAKEKNLAFDREWLALHYYQARGAGKWRSEIRRDAKSQVFFQSPRGSEDPSAELAAFLNKLFLENQALARDGSLQCRFPARFQFLRKNLPLQEAGLPIVACERFEAWRKLVDADSASLLFAAAFLNSPASMYGHTLLELSRSGATKGDALLDYVVAFGAETGSSSGPAYVILGLSGGFSGFFSTVPFYLKIREYNDAESRDIWAYKLNIPKEKLDILIRHLWEVKDVNFSYYFLGANCSYFLLRFLDVVNPDISLTEGLPAWTIPIDTVRALYQKTG